jgi:hypothetical protein
MLSVVTKRRPCVNFYHLTNTSTVLTYHVYKRAATHTKILQYYSYKYSTVCVHTQLAKNVISSGKRAIWLWSHSTFQYSYREFFFRVDYYYYTVSWLCIKWMGNRNNIRTQSQCNLYFKIFTSQYFANYKLLPRNLQHILHKKRSFISVQLYFI